MTSRIEILGQAILMTKVSDEKSREFTLWKRCLRSAYKKGVFKDAEDLISIANKIYYGVYSKFYHIDENFIDFNR